MRLEEAIDHLEEMLADENHEWTCEECRQEHEQLLGWLKELKGLRLENEVILRRFRHLLESNYISQFDQVDPNTKEYIRDIREADRRVMYLCDQEKPCKEDCKKYHHCKRTSDISHAKNFKLVPNGIYPVMFEEVDGAEKRPQGKWLELETNPSEFLGHRFYICSECGREIDVMTPDESLDDYPYCHCGACMIKETEK